MSEPFYKIVDTIAVALTFPEELRLARLWNEHGDLKAREKLVKNYILFTVKTAKRKFPTIPEDDAVSVAHRGLLAAINHFKPDRVKVGRLGTIIPWYLRIEFRKLRRENELVRFPLKAVRDGTRYVSIHSEEGADFLNQGLGTASSAAEQMDRTDRNSAVMAAVSALNPKMQEVLGYVYFGGLTFASAGKLMGVSRERVRQIHVEAIENLRQALEKSTIFTR